MSVEERAIKSEKLLHVCSLSLVLFALCTVGCAFPRIIILDDPLSPEEHINLGVAYEKQGELDNALLEYEKASEKIPQAYLYTGNIYLQKNDYENAEKSYKKALRKDTQNADARNNLAWLYYLQKKNLEEAEKLTLEAIALNPVKQDIYQDTLDKVRELKNKR
ncbi:MAG: tetratricopeptide repeat protein [Nitrospirota bacterium]